MRKGFILLFLLPFFILSPISQVNGISYSYASYIFYINQPDQIEYEDMWFSVGNTESFPLFINCTFKEIFGVNISVNLSWESKYLEPNEIVKNYYTITVNDSFSGVYNLEIDIIGYTLENEGFRVIGGGSVFIGVSYYGDIEGYRLELDITDQAKKPRESQVIIRYKSYEYADSMSYTPIYEFNGTSFNGYLPAGYYQIFARDLETNWIVEESFELNNDTYKNLQLELVRFDFIPMFTDKGDVGVNITILNRIEMLYEVEIYAELYCNNELISQTNKEFRSEFPKARSFRLELWMKPFTWKTGDYEIIGYIDSIEQHIAFKTYSFPYQVPSNPLIDSIVIGLCLLGVILVVQYLKKKPK